MNLRPKYLEVILYILTNCRNYKNGSRLHFLDNENETDDVAWKRFFYLNYKVSVIKQQGMQSSTIAENMSWVKVAEQYCGVYQNAWCCIRLYAINAKYKTFT